MEISYNSYWDLNSALEDGAMNGVTELHESIFGGSDDLAGRMRGKKSLRMDVARHNKRIVGYKIGYALNPEQFYSWLGGVDKAYRNYGIASCLMDRQHQYAKNSGFQVIQTKTKNKWRSMLLLNIKNGFDVAGTYTDQDGEIKIILEKSLLKK
ncbi:GNAT family N-acetyltransferase [Planococcus sp. N064]|uniref:GNAT family N-acetyltransferase n=1 Tax=Planococcus liqunii TaxID=3058394 RepID=A0ABT8MLV8_9BACL|nr:GNAT family N-acetyltransferase [Planococcus sp. N064]MDN7225876.1 GNAT family N-acetyltransferase [Planococcus sp. N064]